MQPGISVLWFNLECVIYGTRPWPAVVEVLLVLIAVEDGEGEHPASDDLSLLEQLSQMHRGVIYIIKNRDAVGSVMYICKNKWTNSSLQ